MRSAFGLDCEKWPKIGRGCKFFPIKSGPAMVGELKVGAAWQALTADRLPRQFDDAIRERRC
eukprot:4688451-Pyramimonas_sp.AAC.1